MEDDAGAVRAEGKAKRNRRKMRKRGHQAALPLDMPHRDAGADLPLRVSAPLRTRNVSGGKVSRLRQFETA